MSNLVDKCREIAITKTMVRRGEFFTPFHQKWFINFKYINNHGCRCFNLVVSLKMSAPCPCASVETCAHIHSSFKTLIGSSWLTPIGRWIAIFYSRIGYLTLSRHTDRISYIGHPISEYWYQKKNRKIH